MRSILLCNTPDKIHYVYASEMLTELAEIAGLDEPIYSKADLLAAPDAFGDVD